MKMNMIKRKRQYLGISKELMASCFCISVLDYEECENNPSQCNAFLYLKICKLLNLNIDEAF